MSNPFTTLARSEHGTLSVRQVALLHEIAAEGDRSVTDYAERLNISKPAITRATDALEERGMVQRATNGDDRRRVRITVTPAGKKLLAQMGVR